MILLGVDPGVTTGYCVVSLADGGVSVRKWGQINHDLSLSRKYQSLIEMFVPKIIVMESVVPTGYLNVEKRRQITAADRLVVEAYRSEVDFVEVTPESRKREKHVPAEVKGAHARDAYRVVVAYLRSRGERLYTENETITNKN